MTAQVVAEQALVAVRPAVGEYHVQVVPEPAVIAAVEQPVRHPGVVAVVAQLGQRHVMGDDPVQVGGRCHQIDDRLGRQSGHRCAADVLDRGEQPGEPAE